MSDKMPDEIWATKERLGPFSLNGWSGFDNGGVRYIRADRCAGDVGGETNNAGDQSVHSGQLGRSAGEAISDSPQRSNAGSIPPACSSLDVGEALEALNRLVWRTRTHINESVDPEGMEDCVYKDANTIRAALTAPSAKCWKKWRL